MNFDLKNFLFEQTKEKLKKNSCLSVDLPKRKSETFHSIQRVNKIHSLNTKGLTQSK